MPGHRIRHGRSAVWQNSSDRRCPPLIMKHCRPPSCSLTAIHYRRGFALILLGKSARHIESLGGQPSFWNEVLKKGRYDIVVSRFAYTSSPLKVFHALHRSHNSTHLRDGCQEMSRNKKTHFGRVFLHLRIKMMFFHFLRLCVSCGKVLTRNNSFSFLFSKMNIIDQKVITRNNSK